MRSSVGHLHELCHGVHVGSSSAAHRPIVASVSSATMTTDAAHRLHEGLIAGFAATASRIPGTWVERREGYAAAACPAIPLPGFNGLWIERDVAKDVIASAVDEVVSPGIPP